ncbi:hypothetical protein C8R43DRAFT_966579, partial [Mycena crocata]
ETTLAAVILASDFLDRGRSPGAIQAVLRARKFPDSDKIDVYPAIPKEEVPDMGRGLSMPWTHAVVGCTPAFKAAVLAEPVLHDVYEGTPISFYCVPANPKNPKIVAAYTGLSNLTTPAEFKQAMRTTLAADPVVIQMISEDHKNVSGDHDSNFVLKVIFHFTDVRTCTAKRRGTHGQYFDVTIYRITFPSFAKDAVISERLQNHIMSPSFTFGSALRGRAKPWLGPNPYKPTPMSCWDCHGVDHYRDDCPIINSSGYRDTRGIVDRGETSSIPTSLNIAPTVPEANDWTHVSYRGAYRARGRGGRDGSRGGGRGNYRGAGRGYVGGFSRGFDPYSL